MVESIHQQLKRERAAALPDARMVQEYRRYAEGLHRSTVGRKERRILGQSYRPEHADNACDLILATAAARLEFTGWKVADEPTQVFLDELYVKNQIADFSYDVHYRAVRDGNHAVGLRWTPDDKQTPAPDEDGVVRPRGRVTLHHEPWWDGETGVFVAFDSANQPLYAVKDFAQVMGDPPRSVNRRTIYFPDRIERYIQVGQGWQGFRLPGDPPDFPDGVAPWTKRDGSPLGIPIVVMPNNRFGRAPYGASDLAGGLLGLQDEINDLQRDITAAARLTAFQMLGLSGVKADAVAKVMVGPGEIIWIEDANGKIVPIPAGDLGQLLGAHQMKLSTFARNSRTPLHLITGGDWPSGAALLRAESPLVSKVTQMGKSLGPGWATVAHRATEIANAFGGLALNEDALITAQFAPPEKLDEGSFAEIQAARVDTMTKLALLEDPVLIKATGLLDDKQIKELMASREKRRAEDLAMASIGGFNDQGQAAQPGQGGTQ